MRGRRSSTSLVTALKREVLIGRARMFERLGSDRYSWPALNRLDRQVMDHLPNRPGTFLEIGANDGYRQSNTWYLERHRGWTGVLIEPLPALYRTCRRARRRSTVFNYACVGPDGPPTVELVDRNLQAVALGMQNSDEEVARLGGSPRTLVSAPTATLSELLDRAGVKNLDFASIDVEGAELEVLTGLDLERHCPSWLLVETKHRDEIAEAVAPYMVLERALSHHDYLFRRA
jgi:FkbM family methyltransferase